MNYPEIPTRFLERMLDQLGEEYIAFEAIYSQPPTHGLRVNTLKLAPSQFEAISPFPLSPLPWIPAGFLVADETRPGKHPYHAAGLYYLQDPHAQAVAEILAPQPGETVLDLAAAPGGKTTHLASRMQNQGLLVANEIKTKRIGHLAANLERWGAHNVAVLNETPERLAEFFGPFFDRVLVDAPCSGEGMFRKDRAAIQGWSEDAINGCAVRQNAILNYAARLVRGGGWLCYSTCTFAEEEDEAVISRFLENHPEFELAAPPEHARMSGLHSQSNMIRLWPHHSSGEGHFIALMRCTGEGKRSTDEHRSRYKRTTPSVPRTVLGVFDAWCRENLTSELPVNPKLVGSRLYAIPEGLPDVSPLRVLHPGWWLGNPKKDRFEPAHALAMGLRVDDVQHAILLPVDSPEVLQYLRCEMLASSGENGWVLVAVSPQQTQISAFPLGWGKRVQGIVKNHYPRGLQRL
jgi:NOL1/NOP2/sun family putative RNA methylase